MRRDIDFHLVPEHQITMHNRMLNWARWCRGSGSSSVSPMFRGYRSTDVWAAPSVSEPVDSIDGMRIAKAVYALPEKHRASVNWHYIKPVAPFRACREIRCTPEALAQLVVDARTMLINRKV